MSIPKQWSDVFIGSERMEEFNQIIEHIEKYSHSLVYISNLYFYFICQKYSIFVMCPKEEIYQNKNNECWWASRVFYKRLVKSNQQGNALLEDYNKAMEQFQKEILTLKTNLYDSYMKVQQLKQ